MARGDEQSLAIGSTKSTVRRSLRDLDPTDEFPVRGEHDEFLVRRVDTPVFIERHAIGTIPILGLVAGVQQGAFTKFPWRRDLVTVELAQVDLSDVQPLGRPAKRGCR